MESDFVVAAGAAPGPDAAARGRAEVARRVVAPAWYPLVVGALVAQHVLVQGAADRNWTLPSGVVLFLGSAAAWLGWRRRTGITVGAWAGWRSLLLLGAWSLLALACAWSAAASRSPAVVAAAAAVGLVGGAVLCRCYVAALRADVRAGAGPVGP